MASNDDLKILITQINTENAVQMAELKEMLKTLTEMVAANKSAPKTKVAAAEPPADGSVAPAPKATKAKEQKPKAKNAWLKESFENDKEFRDSLMKANPDVQTLFDKNATLQKKSDPVDRLKAEANYLAGTVYKNNVKVSEYVDAEYKKYADNFGKQTVVEEPAPKRDV